MPQNLGFACCSSSACFRSGHKGHENPAAAIYHFRYGSLKNTRCHGVPVFAGDVSCGTTEPVLSSRKELLGYYNILSYLIIYLSIVCYILGGHRDRLSEGLYHASSLRLRRRSALDPSALQISKSGLRQRLPKKKASKE